MLGMMTVAGATCSVWEVLYYLTERIIKKAPPGAAEKSASPSFLCKNPGCCAKNCNCPASTLVKTLKSFFMAVLGLLKAI